ncbi:MAG: hypothetical protein H6592_03470 [Flavobacteriales bacterium]|nr:hypothetical protein [Flavobacteriales bacterium]
MKDILPAVQQRIERLRGEDRAEAERIIVHALRQIDLIQEQKALFQEIQCLRMELESDRDQKKRVLDMRDDEWLSSTEVLEVLGHERTYLWELGQAELLKPFEKRGNGNRYRVRDLRRFLAIDAQLVGRTLNEWRATNKGQRP